MSVLSRFENVAGTAWRDAKLTNWARRPFKKGSRTAKAGLQFLCGRRNLGDLTTEFVTLREGFEPRVSPPVAAPRLVIARPLAASRQVCSALLAAAFVQCSALPRAAVCLPTREQCLQPCCCRNNQQGAGLQKSSIGRCAPWTALRVKCARQSRISIRCYRTHRNDVRKELGSTAPKPLHNLP
jgi:hypothetical protein